MSGRPSRWNGRVPPRNRWLAVVIGALLVEGALLYGASRSTPFSASVSWNAQGEGLHAEVTVRSGSTPTSVRVSLLPGQALGQSRGHELIAFVDPAYPFSFGPYSDAATDSYWIGTYLRSLGWLSADAETVTVGSNLPSLLHQYPNGTLLILDSGIVPDTLLSNSSTLLRDWLRAGGTLVWAGGPIGYQEGHLDAAGRYVAQNMGWRGQVTLLGFNLTDPAAVGAPPLTPTSGPETSAGTALGLSYVFAGYGANVTELELHGGTSLGAVTPGTGPNGSSPRTSIALLPVGHGTLLYFGGGTAAQGNGELPEASPQLTQDIAVLLDLGYHPGPGPSASTVVTLSPWGRSLVPLTLVNRSAGAVAFARSSVLGSYLYVWAEAIAEPRPTLPRTHAARRVRWRSRPIDPRRGRTVDTGPMGPKIPA